MAGGPVCAACMYRNNEVCGRNCRLAPYFPAEMYDDYVVLRLFHGECNLIALLDMVPAEEDKREAVHSLIVSARMRKADPVRGIVGVEMNLRSQLEAMKKKLALAKKELAEVKRGRY